MQLVETLPEQLNRGSNLFTTVTLRYLSVRENMAMIMA